LRIVAAKIKQRPITGTDAPASTPSARRPTVFMSNRRWPLSQETIFYYTSSAQEQGWTGRRMKLNDVLIDGEVPGVRFACDLARCQGACCTIPGGFGAPLLPEEPAEIERAFGVVRAYLPEEHLFEIERGGLVVGSLASPATPCYDDRACVYVTYDRGVAKCSFERAFLAGETVWRKPLSCHLFPLRAERGIRHRLRFEFIHECMPAIQRGRSEDIHLWRFLGDPLIRAYGPAWYARFVRHCERDHRPPGTDFVV
jgi:hypothetical protein